MAVFGSEKRRLNGEFGILIGAIVASIAFVMELTLFPLLLGAIQEDLGLTVGNLSWAFNAYAIAIAVAVLAGGIVGDMVNKQWMFLVGAFAFAIGSVLSASADSLQSLIVGRAVQGLGGGLFSPLVPILLTESTARRSGKILMIWGGLAGITATLLPLVGNAVMMLFGWRVIFLLFAVVAAVALVLIAIGTPKKELNGRRSGFTYRHLLSLRGIWPVLIYIFLTYGCFTYLLFFFPISLHADGYGTQYISIFLTFVWLTFSVLSFVLRNRIDGAGLHRSLLLAPAFLALSIALGVSFQDQFMLQILAAIFAGAGLACSNAPSTHLLLSIAPSDLRVLSSSLDISFARIGGAVTVALLSAASPNTALIVIAGFTILAMIVCSNFSKKERKLS